MALIGQELSMMIAKAQLVRDVSIDINPGTVNVVMGPNGAGKTSLLRLLSGEWRPSAGNVMLDGVDLREVPPAIRARKLAVLPQHSTLNFPFTAREVVMLGRIPHDSGARRDREIVTDALAAVDATYFADREYTYLSGGERQRVHLARVLAQIWEADTVGERFLILDEPTASFDLAHQELTLEIVRQLAARGIGVLMVLHDLNLAARCADHIVLLQCGGIAACGSAAEVLTRDTLKSVFQVEAHISTHPVAGTPLVVI